MLCITPLHVRAKGAYLRTGDRKLILELLRSNEPLPDEFRAFVADLLEGKVKRKVGNPKKRPFQQLYDDVLACDIKEDYEKLLCEYQKEVRNKCGTPTERAKAAIAQKYNKSEEIISQIVYPRKSKKVKVSN